MELEFRNVGFCVSKKTGIPREKLPGKGENKQQTKPTYGTGSEPNLGYIGGGESFHHCAIPAPLKVAQESVALPDMDWSAFTYFHVATPRHFHKASLLFQRFLYVVIRDTEDSKKSLCSIRLNFSEDDNFDQVRDSGQLSVQQACV